MNEDDVLMIFLTLGPTDFLNNEEDLGVEFRSIQQQLYNTLASRMIKSFAPFFWLKTLLNFPRLV